MKKNLHRLLSATLALAVLMGLTVPVLADDSREYAFSIVVEEDYLVDDGEETVPGFGDNMPVTYLKAGSTIEIFQDAGSKGEIQEIWVSAAGENDKVYFFDRSLSSAPLENVAISFTSGKTRDGKTVDLSDPNKIYLVTIRHAKSDGSETVIQDFYRVVNETGGEYVVNDETAYTNPLIVKDGLDYDDLDDDALMYTDGIEYYEPCGYYRARKGEKYGLLDSKGNELVPPVYDSMGRLSDGLVRVGKNIDGEKKYGFVDISTGELVIPLEYDDDTFQGRTISDFSNGVAVISESYRDEDGYVDGIGNVPTWGVRYGLIDKNGKEIVPMGKYSGFARSYEPPYQIPYKIRVTTGGFHYYCFTDNRIVAQDGNKWVVLDTSGTVLFELNYDSVFGYKDGFAVIRKFDGSDDSKVGLIDTAGNVVVPPKYDSIESFNHGYARVGMYTDTGALYGLLDRQGELVVPMLYDDVYTFREGMALVMKEDASGSPKYGFVDMSGQLVIPCIYDSAGHFCDGLASVGILNHELSEYKGDDNNVYMCGYIDKQGKTVIPLEYNYASSFKNGVAMVENGTLGVMEISIWSEYFGPALWVPGTDENKHWKEKFQNFGIQPEYKYMDTAGKILASFPVDFETVGPGNDRFYVDRNNGKCAIMRNPFYRENAAPTRSTVLVNGQNVAFDAYTINGNNYFKLRDLAKALNGTGKQFEVTWDGKNNAIDLLAGKSYTTVGGELAQGDGTGKTAQVSTAAIYLDGRPVSLLAYTIGGNNYFKLRDVGQTFGFNVSWDGARNTIVIDTTQSYTPD